MSRRDVPVVAAAEDDTIDMVECLDPVLLKTSARSTAASAAVGLTAFSLNSLPFGIRNGNKVTFTIKNVRSEGSGTTSNPYEYVVTFSNAENISIPEDERWEITDNGDTLELTAELAQGGSVQIPVTLLDLTQPVTYTIVQREMEHNHFVDIVYDHTKVSGSVSGETEDGDSEVTETVPYGYQYDRECYGSLIEMAEDLARAANKCKNWGELQELLHASNINSIKNEEYRACLAEGLGLDGKWPKAADEGLSELLYKSNRYDREKQEFYGIGYQNKTKVYLDSYYLNVYVKPAQFDKTGAKTQRAQAVPYISLESTLNGGNKWRAFILYDQETGKWYENPNSSDNPQSLAGLLKMTALQFVQEYGWTELMDGTSTGVTDNDNNSASGSFQSNGFLYNVAVSFINNYSVPQPEMYTVTFYQEDRTSVVDTRRVEAGAAVENPPSPAQLEGKNFVKWDQDLTDITSDLDVYPVYEEAQEPIPPESTETPEEPDTPAKPDTPANPDTPETPSTPETPDAPVTPDTPETPDSPDSGNHQGGGNGSSGGSGSSGSSSGGPGNSATYVSNGPGHEVKEIAPGETPLAVMPANASSAAQQAMTMIDDGEVPLAAIPKTGNRSAAAELTMLVSGVLLAVYMALGKNRRKEQ